MEWDVVSRPRHYTVTMPVSVDGAQVSATVECRRLIAALGLSYYAGTAFAYLFRHRTKGNVLEDLRKARAYIDFEIERIEASLSSDEQPR